LVMLPYTQTASTPCSKGPLIHHTGSKYGKTHLSLAPPHPTQTVRCSLL
jgi:hypothetical protein